MKLIEPVHNNDLPFSFLPGYGAFINKWSGSKSHMLLAEQNETVVPVKITQVGPYKTGQLLYTPLSKSGADISSENEKVFFTELLQFFKKSKTCIRLQAHPEYFVTQGLPDHVPYCSFGHYKINLAANEKTLFSQMHPKHRNSVSSASNKGLVIRSGKEVLKDFYNLYAGLMNRQKIYCDPLPFFEAMFNGLGEQNLLCRVVYYQDKPLGAVLLPYSNYGAYYLNGASAETMPISGAMNYLHWDSMLLLKSKNVKTYSMGGYRLSNIEGTKFEGIQRFKERFGGEKIEGFLWKKDILGLNCRLLDTMLAMKGIKKHSDMIDRESKNK